MLRHVVDQRRQHVTSDHRVESVGRLVEHEELRSLREGEEHHRLALLPLGELSEQAVRIELERREQPLGPCSIPGWIERRVEPQCLPYRERGIEMGLFGDVAYPRQNLRGMGWD